jgi:hypothetical protein
MSLHIKRIKGKKHRVIITMLVDIDDGVLGDTIGNAVDPDAQVDEVIGDGWLDTELRKNGIRTLMVQTMLVPPRKNR